MDELIVELKSIPFEDILSNPISAIVEGESRAARATADFIREVGFEPPDPENFDEDLGPMRMVFFKMDRVDPEGNTNTVTIQVPLLSLIPIPAIQVKEAVIDFSVRIHEIEKIQGQKVGSGKLFTPKKHRLFGSVMRRKSKAKKDTETESNVDMGIKVTLQQADFPIGVMRLFDLLEQGITEKPQPVQ